MTIDWGGDNGTVATTYVSLRHHDESSECRHVSIQWQGSLATNPEKALELTTPEVDGGGVSLVVARILE